MRYCQDCGIGHECDGAVTGDRESDAVAIARIEAERDKFVAKVSAASVRAELETAEEIAETEAEAEVEVAVAEAEGMAAAAEVFAEAAPEDAPMIVNAPEMDATAGADAEELPPAEEGSPVPEPSAPQRHGLGMW